MHLRWRPAVNVSAPRQALSGKAHRSHSTLRPGDQRSGLLTSDLSVNGNAPVVLMTTEVLRNMLYADSPALQGFPDNGDG